MTKVKLLAAATLAAAAVLSGAATAQPPGFLFMKTYYSDATLSNVIGTQADICVNGNVGSGPVQGSSSAYFTREAVGECPGGYW